MVLTMKKGFSIPSAVINKATHVSLIVLAVLLPLLAVPFTDSFINDTKIALFFLAGIIILGLYALKIFSQKTITVTFSPFATGLTVFGAAAVASTLFNNPFPAQSLLAFGGVYITMALLVGLASCILEDKVREHSLVTALGISGAVLGVVSLLQMVGYGPSHLYNQLFSLNIPATAVFNLVESPFVATQVLSVILVGILAAIFQQLRPSSSTEKQGQAGVLLAVAAGLIVGLGVNIYSILPGKFTAPLLPPFDVSWSVAIDALRTPRTALIGFGPDSYRVAYNLFKPAGLNMSDYYGIDFNQGANVPLTLLVTLGLFGLLSWLFLVVHIVKKFIKDSQLRQHPTSWMLMALVVIQFLFPPHAITMILFALVLTFWLAIQHQDFEHVKLYTLMTRLSNREEHKTSYTHVFSQALAVILLLVAVVALYGFGRGEAAAFTMFRSSLAAAQNNAVQTYELQQQAIQLNPYIDTYRRRYGLTNLTIATALANKADLTEAEQAQIVQLIQQSIREGRAATTLQPNYYGNWQVLAQIYTNLIGVATGAEDWAVNAYVRGVELSPTNPDLRLQLGSVFFQREQYQEAAQLFQQATNLKPDHANAYYNLANALVQLGQLQSAEQVYLAVLELIEPGTEDYQKASNELKQIQAQIEQMPADESESAQADQPSVIEDGLDGDVVNPSDQELPSNIQEQFGGDNAADENEPAAGDETGDEIGDEEAINDEVDAEGVRNATPGSTTP